MNRSLIEEIFEVSQPFLKRDLVMLKPHLSSNVSYSLKNEKDKVVFISEAMGLKHSDIEMSFKNKHLNVSSKNKNSKSQFVSVLNHHLYISENIDKENVKASLENGILTIDMPIEKSKKDFEIKF